MSSPGSPQITESKVQKDAESQIINGSSWQLASRCFTPFSHCQVVNALEVVSVTMRMFNAG